MDQLRKDLGKASESAKESSKDEIEALRAEADQDKAKYHATYNDLTELKEALHKVGVEVRFFYSSFDKIMILGSKAGRALDLDHSRGTFYNSRSYSRHRHNS